MFYKQRSFLGNPIKYSYCDCLKKKKKKKKRKISFFSIPLHTSFSLEQENTKVATEAVLNF